MHITYGSVPSIEDNRILTQAAATRIGRHAWTYLSDALRQGYVVSRFRGGVNVAFEGGSPSTYLTVQTPDVPLHPWAVEVGSAPSVPVGSEVVATSRRIRLGPDAVLDLSSAAVDPLRIVPYTAEQATRSQVHAAAMRRLVERSWKMSAPDPFRPEIETILEACRSQRDLRRLARLVGLGTGSTPGGDDVLVGLLAGLTALSGVSPRARRSLRTLRRSLRRSRPSMRTPPASGQALAAAADGSFPEPLRDLVHTAAGMKPADFPAVAESVLALGATSGRYLVEGVAAAMTLVG